MTIPKFRAWLKDENRMTDVLQIDFSMNMILDNDCNWYSPHEYELMQSTGLFDKNGKEIFESDIVKVLNSLYTVFYDSEKGSFRLKPHDKRWHTDYMSNFSHGGNFEVIGNMYEGVSDDNS